ncbi:MAG: hypothetical protein K2O17_07760 [Bacteroidaceae bacterium]|nr:hypothetical protein [Bacteroidaceae bacterium]
MKKQILLLLLWLFPFCKAAEPWRLHLQNKDEGVILKMDLYEESIDVPGMEMFGPMNGFLGGKGIYGVWMVTSFDIKDERTVTLRLSNDLGSETQAVRLTQQSDSLYLMELLNGVVVKKAVNRKLIKIPAAIQLTQK